MRNKYELYKYPKFKKKRTVSVLVPAYNEEDTIKDTVEAILSSDYDKLIEVIVINDGSKDKTAKIVKELMKKYPKLKLLDKKNSGKSDSLNKGIKIAKGELVALVDADSYPGKQAIRKIAGYFDNEKIAAVTSCVNVRNRNKWLEYMQAIEYVMIAWTRKLFEYVDSVFVTNGPLSIYRKSALEKVGGFDPNIMIEDTEITWHLLNEGYKTRMCLSARVSTTVPSTFKAWKRQRERWAIGGFQIISKYKKSFFKKGMFGLFVIPFVAFSIFLVTFGLLFSAYILIKRISLISFYTGYTFAANTPLLSVSDIGINPDVLWIFLAMLFTITILFTIVGTVIVKETQLKTLKRRNIFNFLTFFFIYVIFSQFVWITAVYRLIKKDFKW